MTISDFEKERLLIPGWAGLLTLEEVRHIQSQLFRRLGLRRKWKIRGKRPHLTTIAMKAFPEKQDVAKRNIQKLQSRESRRNRISARN